MASDSTSRNQRQEIDFASLMATVARLLFGDPDDTKGDNWRYGNHGSLSIDVKRGIWVDHEASEGSRHVGGGVIDLIQREICNGTKDEAAALQWLVNQGLIEDTEREQQVIVGVYPFEHPNDPAVTIYAEERSNFRKPDGSWVLTDDGKRKKKILQKRPDPEHPEKWIYKLKGARIPTTLYRLSATREAISKGELVLIPEGPPKVDLLRSWDFAATCNSGGSKYWTAKHAALLKDADVVILPDHDAAGAAWTATIGATLTSVAKRVRVLELPGLKAKGDIKDWAEAGGTAEKLLELLESAARPWQSSDLDDRPVGFSDDALALAFAEKHANELRYVASRGKWLLWKNNCWKDEDTILAVDKARKICREQAALCEGGDRAKNKITSAPTVMAVEKLARSDRRLASTVEQFNTGLGNLHTPQGVVDLATGETRASQPDDYNTLITAVHPAPPGTSASVWLAFLKKVTNENGELISFLQRFFGYCLTGYVTEQVLMFLYGTGNNGKGVFISTVSGIMGDYAIAA